MPPIFSVVCYAEKIKFCCLNQTFLSFNVRFDSFRINFLGLSLKLPRLFHLHCLKKTNPLATKIVPQPHTYVLFDYDRSIGLGRQDINLGDFIQTIAAENAIRTIDKQAEFIIYQRDNLQNYHQRPALCIMQGWFAHSHTFLPSSRLTPVFAGTHLASKAQEYFAFLIKHHRSYWQNADFGCRDQSTLEFMKKQNLPAYLSRCLTLTLPKRTEQPQNPEIFIVNVDDDIFELLPEDIKKHGKRINQRAIHISKERSFREYISQAGDLLEMYKKRAGLVITSAIHCASPCTAMGIPAILIYKHNEHLSRFSAVKNIIPLYSPDDIRNNLVNWHPQVPDIEKLKQLMLENLRLSIKKAQNQNVDENKLNDIRNKIAAFSSLNNR